MKSISEFDTLKYFINKLEKGFKIKFMPKIGQSDAQFQGALASATDGLKELFTVRGETKAEQNFFRDRANKRSIAQKRVLESDKFMTFMEKHGDSISQKASKRAAGLVIREQEDAQRKAGLMSNEDLQDLRSS